MWRGVLPVRPGAWFCLLGSTLALAAFFVPYFEPPPGSLWDIMLLYWTGTEGPPGLIWLSVFLGVFLLPLMGMVGLALQALGPRLLRWEITRWYRRFTILALMCYMVITLVSFLLYWLASLLGGGFPQVTIGGWLLPLGLLLALIGSILVPRQTGEQPSEGVSAHPVRQVFQRSLGRFMMIVVVVLLFARSLLVAFQPQGEFQLLQSSISLSSISMVSPSEGWAVGDYTDQQGHRQGRIYHYQAGVWKPDTVPSGSGGFTRVWMLSPQEGWVVGFDTILHYQQGLWQEAPNPFPRDALESISMISPTQGWIVGLRGATLQYVHGQWEQAPSDTSAARFGVLSGVAMVSTSEAWAVGDGAILHYADSVWKTAVSLTNISLSAIAMVSAEEGWAVGFTEASTESGVIMRYSQGKWVQVKVPDLNPEMYEMSSYSLVKPFRPFATHGQTFGASAQKVLWQKHDRG